MQEYCVCGHLKKDHLIDQHGQFCFACSIWNRPINKELCHNFKLDNLKYIEHLAKERNLI